MSSEFAIGILSGLISVALVALFNQVWRRILIPWYENLLYKGAEIAGTWEGTASYLTTGGTNKIVMKLSRVGYFVSGIATAVAGEDEGASWNVSGSFRNTILTLTYDSTDKRKLDRGSLCFMLVNNGDELRGGAQYYSGLDNAIHAYTLSLNHVSA